MFLDNDRNPGLYPERAVLLGEEVGLPRMSGISPERLSGMICTRGSVLSHGVVIARALGIAAVVGVEVLPLSQCEGREIIADAGSDKALPYLPMHESNPALGQRGIRLSLEYPGMFLVQLRAMLRANVGLGNLRLLLPMVTLPKELDEAKALIEQALDDLHSSGISVPSPPVGIMLEVPAAVFRAAELAVRADFVSIGSNDLTQYILAADHTNPHVTTLCDPMSPAVLEAIGMAVERVRTCAIPVSVCGEMAGDPLAAPLLLGLGVDALSMSPRSIPRVKQVIRKFDTSQAHDLWQRALACRDAIQVRSLLAGALDAAGLGGLVRAGK